MARWLLLLSWLIAACVPAVRLRTATSAVPPAIRIDLASLGELLLRARLERDAGARAVLAERLGLAGAATGEAPGEKMTETVLTELVRLSEQASDPNDHDWADLFRADLDELDGGCSFWSVAETRHRVARSQSSASAYALLALHSSCLGALTDAFRAPLSQRANIANYCLYSLSLGSDGDPSSYFDDDPATRPPDPPWSQFWRGLDHLLDELPANVDARWRNIAAHLRVRQDELRDRGEREGIEPPRVEELLAELPLGDGAPYDHLPWLVVDHDLATVGAARYTLYDHELSERIVRPLMGDPVRRLALFVLHASSVEPVIRAGELARSTAMTALEVVVASQEAAGGARRAKIVELEFPGEGRRDRPHQAADRPPSLTLILRPEGVDVRGANTSLSFAPGHLAERIAELRRTFPDDGGVFIALDPTAHYEDFIALVNAARRSFHRLILTEIPKPTSATIPRP